MIYTGLPVITHHWWGFFFPWKIHFESNKKGKLKYLSWWFSMFVLKHIRPLRIDWRIWSLSTYLGVVSAGVLWWWFVFGAMAGRQGVGVPWLVPHGDGKQVFSIMTLLTFAARSLSVLGAVLCITGCLAASLVSTHQMPVASTTSR